MAEMNQGGQPVFGLAMPHPQEAEIRSQNADRIARYKAAATLAASVAQTSGSDLDRRNPQRKVGGTFEKLQKVPARQTPKNLGINQSDLMKFLSAFNFDAIRQEVGHNTFFSSFGPGPFGLIGAGQPNSALQ